MNASDIMKYGQRTLMGSLDGLPDEHWQTSGVYGWWSVKEIIAHLASYEAAIGDVLASLTGDGPTPTLDRLRTRGAASNDEEVEARESMSVSDTLAELAREHERVTALVGELSPELLRQLGTLPWYGDAYSVDDLLVYIGYGHKRELAAQVGVFLDGLAAA